MAALAGRAMADFTVYFADSSEYYCADGSSHCGTNDVEPLGFIAGPTSIDSNNCPFADKYIATTSDGGDVPTYQNSQGQVIPTEGDMYWNDGVCGSVSPFYCAVGLDGDDWGCASENDSTQDYNVRAASSAVVPLYRLREHVPSF